MTSAEKLAALTDGEWRRITNKMSWAYRRGESNLPLEVEWKALTKKVNAMRLITSRKKAQLKIDQRLEARRAYMRTYMANRRREAAPT